MITKHCSTFGSDVESTVGLVSVIGSLSTFNVEIVGAIPVFVQRGKHLYHIFIEDAVSYI
jgi:hypothetical protein